MTERRTVWRLWSGWVLVCCAAFPAWAQETADAVAVPAQKLEQAWDVVEVMGKPVQPGGRTPRVVFKGAGALLVDGGCNHFSGRVERDDGGQLRVSKYSGTHNECAEPSRSEAVLNAALVMVNNYRLGDSLVLRSGEDELVRLAVSPNQDSAEIEQSVTRHAAKVGAAAKSTRSQAVQGKSRKSANGTKTGGTVKGKAVTKSSTAPAKPKKKAT